MREGDAATEACRAARGADSVKFLTRRLPDGGWAWAERMLVAMPSPAAIAQELERDPDLVCSGRIGRERRGGSSATVGCSTVSDRDALARHADLRSGVVALRRRWGSSMTALNP